MAPNNPKSSNGQPELPDECKEVFDEAFETYFENGKAERQQINWRPMNMVELLTEPEPSAVWILDSYLPEGTLAVLSAHPKAGKSTLAYRMTVSVAQGKPFIGKKTKRCGVLILAVEEHRRDVRNRLKWFGATEGDPIYVAFSRPPKVEALKAFVIENHIGLVVIDSLSRFWKIENENDNAQVMRELSPLLDIAHETDRKSVV